MKLKDLLASSLISSNITDKLTKTIEFRRLMLELAKFAPGKFSMTGEGKYVASWSEDARVDMSVNKPSLTSFKAPVTQVQVVGHVRKPVPRALLDAMMDFCHKHKYQLDKLQIQMVDDPPRTKQKLSWWIFTVTVPLGHFSED